MRAISENQVMSIKNFTQDRNNEMDIIANYQLTQDVILYSLGEKESPLARNYVDNLLKERKKYSIFVASISVVDRNFQVVSSSEEYKPNTVSAMKDVDPKYQTGEFMIGDVYERMTDDGRKNGMRSTMRKSVRLCALPLSQTGLYYILFRCGKYLLGHPCD